MTKDQLDRLQKALGKLAETTGSQPAAGDGTEQMTPEQFTGYVAEQIEKAAEDRPEVRKVRLQHLREQVATVAKNFEGPTPTPGNSLVSVQRFQDPGQQTTTEQTRSAGGAAPSAATNYSQGNPPPNAQGVGSQPAGGDLPPKEAGPSGAMGAEATFAKSLEAIVEKLDGLQKGDGGGQTQDPPQSTATPPASQGGSGERETTEKSLGVIWPIDMNTSYGLGDKDELPEPEWGYDKGSEAEQVLKAQREKKPAEQGGQQAAPSSDAAE